MSPAEPEAGRPESVNNLLQATTTIYPRLNGGSQTQKIALPAIYEKD